MQAAKALQKIRERGLKIREDVGGWRGYVGSNDRHWYEMRVNRDGAVSGFYIRGINEESHPEYDHFVGSYPKNLKSFLDALCPPANRFKVSDAVIGKNKKRTIKQGFANEAAIVVSTHGSYYDIVLLSSGAKIEYVSELDIELAKTDNR